MKQYKSEKAKVSVLTTVYNGFPYLPETVEGVLNQTFKDFEYVIVDDGSDDETRSYLDTLDDPRVRVVLLKRSGRGVALNVGVNACRSDLVAIIDADDVDSPIRLEVQYNAMKAYQDIDVLSCLYVLNYDDLHVEDSNDLEIVNIDPRNFVRRTQLQHPGAMIRRGALLGVGGYDERRKNLFDYDLWLRLAEKGHKLARISAPLIYKRLHKGQKFEESNRFEYLWAGFKCRMRSFCLFSKNPLDIFYPFAGFIFGFLPLKIRRKIFSL